MSHDNNTVLLELAEEHINFWQGTHWAEIIQEAVDNKDLEKLHELIFTSAKAMYQDYVMPMEKN